MKKEQLIKVLEKIPGNPEVSIRLGHRGRGELAGVQNVETYRLHPKSDESIVLSDINPDWYEEDDFA